MAAEPGFEPGLKDPKSSVLPLHNSAISDQLLSSRYSWCRRSDSNRHGGFPPTVFETAASAIPPLRLGIDSSHSVMVPRRRFELRRAIRSPPPQDGVSTYSTTSAKWQEWQDSNPRPAVLETAALPTELHSYPSNILSQHTKKIKTWQYYLLTPHPLSLSPYEGEREEILERGFHPLSFLLPLPLSREGGQGDRLVNNLISPRPPIRHSGQAP
jgi:hypothetical protein